MKKKSFPLAKVYTLLEPGPVTLITTTHKGRHNIMTQSWHMMMEFVPPLVGCLISGNNFSFSALMKHRECVINIPTAELAKQVVGIGNCSGETTEKFHKFGLTPRPSSKVDAPLIEECYASLECVLSDTRFVNKYNFFVLEVVKAWVNTSVKNPRTLHHCGNGEFMIAGDHIKLRSRMK